MNGSIFLTSFAATYCVGSNSRISPAMRVGNVDASKCVIGPMPLLPAVMFAQAVATSLPTGLMMPRPVTTTRRLLIFQTCLESQAGLIGPYGAVCLRTPKKQKLRLVAQLPVLSIGKNSSLDV